MSSDKPPEFFLDRSLGKTSARRLRDAGHVVHLIAEFYPRDAQEIGDAEWIAEGCRRGWTLLTKDRRIRYRTDELGALTSGHLFCLAEGNATLDQITQCSSTPCPPSTAPSSTPRSASGTSTQAAASRRCGPERQPTHLRRATKS